LVTLGSVPIAGPAAAAVTSKLPDLAVLAPFSFRIEISPTGRRLLRFSTVIVNIGSGPLRMYGYDENDGVASIGDTLKVRQQIRRSDGTWRVRNTTATMKYAADGHNHFHAVDLQRIKIQNLNHKTLRNSAKTGFCFLDSYVYGSTKPSRYNSANSVCNIAPSKTVPMGISVRWGDIYRSTLAFQWIDITGMPSGDYLIKIIADPPWRTGGRFLESNESNNRGWARIRITKTGVTVISKSARP
ncbi:MAG TPA: lysyl oxidase family protein, partial [Candidatus Limnocylindria bacterium]|nr:lysyl oxidase family protein [Candidatus Limnocylindria bacterium]